MMISQLRRLKSKSTVQLVVSSLVLSSLPLSMAVAVTSKSPRQVMSSSPSPAPSAKPVALSDGRTLCQEWVREGEIGRFPTDLLDEASGLVASRQFPALYLVNDSGDGPHLYTTGMKGGATQKIVINDFKPVDTEDMSVGPCPGASTTCLAIADLGDNSERRKKIDVLFLEEKNPMPSPVHALARVSLRYPDRPHNAEAFAVLPNGDLVIVSKEVQRKEAQPAQVFRAKAKDGATMERIGEIDVPGLLGDKSYGGRVTGMSVTSDGKRFLLLTYSKALEFNLDLTQTTIPATKNLKLGQDYSIIDIQPLAQQEAIVYDRNDRDFYYTTEVVRRLFSSNALAPLMRMKCKK